MGGHSGMTCTLARAEWGFISGLKFTLKNIVLTMIFIITSQILIRKANFPERCKWHMFIYGQYPILIIHFLNMVHRGFAEFCGVCYWKYVQLLHLTVSKKSSKILFTTLQWFLTLAHALGKDIYYWQQTRFHTTFFYLC